MRNILLILFFMTVQLYCQNISISGIVQDKVTAEPIAGAVIFIEGTLYGSSTDKSGYFRIDNIPPGIYNLIVSAVGYKSHKLERVGVIDREVSIVVQLESEKKPHQSETLQKNQVVLNSKRETVTTLKSKKSMSLFLVGGYAGPVSPEEFSKYWQPGVNLSGGIGVFITEKEKVLISICIDYSVFPFNSDKFLKDIGYSSYNIKIEGGETKILSVLLDFRGFITNLYVIGGIGLYNFEINDARVSSGTYYETAKGSSESGVSVAYGAGLKLPIANSFDLFIELKALKGTIIDTNKEYETISLGAGLALKF